MCAYGYLLVNFVLKMYVRRCQLIGHVTMLSRTRCSGNHHVAIRNPAAIGPYYCSANHHDDVQCLNFPKNVEVISHQQRIIVDDVNRN